MNDQLPPFSGDSPTCPKCGNVGATTRYRAASPRMLWDWNDATGMRGQLPERLERECDRCDWHWDEALVDQPAHDGPSVAECTANDRAHWNDKYAGEQR
ncbi:hypothetical protein ACFV90_36870 [Streptomyces sp. NPDC059904]|uniref:hypothetical protein n=1 Tax=Streptomyces sp. NPDC059904 TaxID=3346996 RepID=UPI00364864B8